MELENFSYNGAVEDFKEIKKALENLPEHTFYVSKSPVMVKRSGFKHIENSQIIIYPKENGKINSVKIPNRAKDVDVDMRQKSVGFRYKGNYYVIKENFQEY